MKPFKIFAAFLLFLYIGNVEGQTARKLLLLSKQPTTIPAPDFFMNLAGPGLPSNLTCTRASTATYFDVNGNLQTASANVARFDYDPLIHTPMGLLLEGVQDATNDGISVNLIRNNTMQGASVGTLPTNWAFNNNSNGLSASVVATGTQQNMAYVDVQISGTTTSSSASILYFETTNAIAQSSSTTYGNSVYVELSGGTNSNVINISNDLEERNSSGTVLATVPGNNEYDSLPLPYTGLMRLAKGVVANTANTAYVVPGITITPSGSNVAINLTIRIAAPQLEIGSYGVSSVILTSGSSTASRYPDICTINGAAGSAITGTNVSVMADYTPGTQLGAHYRMFVGSSGPVGLGDDNAGNTMSNNSLLLLTNPVLFGYDFPYLGAIAAGPASRTIANGSASYGGSFAQDTSNPLLTTRFGCDNYFQSCPNGHFWALSIWKQKLTPAQLESVTAIVHATTAWGDSYTQGVGSSIPYGGTTYGGSFPYLRYGWVGWLWSKFSTPINIFNEGIGGQNSSQIEARMVADTLHTNDNVVIWIGRNDIGSGLGGACAPGVVTNAQNMVAHLAPGNTRYLILGIVNFPAEVSGTNDYNSIICTNNALAAAFPNNYFDIRAAIVSASGGANDAPNYNWFFQNVPQSGTYDHPNDNGYRFIGQEVYNWGHTHGWNGY